MKVKEIIELLKALDDDLDVKFIDLYDVGIEVMTVGEDFYYSEKEQSMWEDDICWCMDSETCTNYDCFRHLTHMSESQIFTCSHLRNTDCCPLTKESEE